LQIKEIYVYSLKIPYRQSAPIASYDYPYTESVIVEIRTDENITGYGEAVTDPVFTGETFDSIVGAIKNYLGPAIFGSDPFAIEEIHKRMDEALVKNTAAKTAIDTACFDIIGKATKRPVYKILGGKFNSEIFEVPEIVFEPLPDIEKHCREAVERGVKCLKVKVGESLEKDVEKIKLIREVVGEDVEIRLDANQGWKNYWTAIKIIKKLEKYDIALIEQPLPEHDLQGTAKLRRMIDIPIMLDESIHSIYDVLTAVKFEACDMVSLKTMKAGGLLKIKEITKTCQALGIPCHMGTSWESEVGWAANLHLIAGLSGIKLWDAYSPTEIYWGYNEGIATPIRSYLKNGIRMVQVPEGPGLGIKINLDMLNKYLVSKPLHLEQKD